MTHFDVIVIGGRPAGSTLAARLGKYGINTLLVERGTFPSLPATSCPIIYAATMQMLDEIGADEAEYAYDTPKITRLHLHGRSVQSGFDIPADNGRDYAYAIDRARFDHSLWKTAARYPTVTARTSFTVTDVLRDGDRVSGIIGKNKNGDEERITADLVVGADGRFGMVARKVGAAVMDEHDEYPTSIYYAYWKNLRPYMPDSGATSVAYEGAPGTGYLVMDSADNTAAVAVEGRADLMNPGPGRAEEFYLEQLQATPDLWARFDGAEMITTVRGMKNIGNLYHEAGGPGWALVGDAYHQKDPLDGQGIYNAVFTSKALAWAIRDWKNGEKTWQEAVTWYDETARIKTYAMYKALMRRVKASLYGSVDMPDWLQDRLARWTLDDPALNALFGQFITRQMPADAMQLMTPALTVRAMARGLRRDIQDRARSLLPF